MLMDESSAPSTRRRARASRRRLARGRFAPRRRGTPPISPFARFRAPREVCYRPGVNDDLILRPARRDELDAVARLAGKLVRLHHAFDAQRFFVPNQVEEGYAWWFGREIDRPEVVLLIAERAGAVVGYAYGRVEERDWNQLLDAHGALHDLWVEEAERRHGVAARLVEAMIAALGAKGAPRVVLHTAADNAGAQALFARLGFRRTMIEMTRETATPDATKRSPSP
jgi:ribosomal protein S18 acetylase RimI-like enzyme